MNLQARTNAALAKKWWATLLSVLLLLVRVCNSQTTPPWRFNPQYENLGFSYGMASNGTPSILYAEMGAIQEVGKWVRAEVSWALVQREGPNQSFDWSTADKWIVPALQNNLSVLAILGSAPTWAWPDGVREGAVHSSTLWVNPAPAMQYLHEWKVYCANAAAYLRDKGIHHYEIENEPNSQFFYMTKYNELPLDVIPYATLLQAAADTIRFTDPHAFIVCGSLWPQVCNQIDSQMIYFDYNENGVVIADSAIISKDVIGAVEWLEIQYLNPSFKSSCNAIGYHPYAHLVSITEPQDATIDPEYNIHKRGGPIYQNPNDCFNLVNYIDEIHTSMIAHADITTTVNDSTLNKRIWGTEFGLNLSGSSYATQDSLGRSVNALLLTDSLITISASWIDDYLSIWTTRDFTGPLMFYRIRDYLHTDPHGNLDTTNVVGWPQGREFHGALDFEFNKRPAYYELSKWGHGYISGVIDIDDGRSLERWAPDLHYATVRLTADIELPNGAYFGSGHQVTIVSDDPSNLRTITGPLFADDCNLTLRDVHVRQTDTNPPETPVLTLTNNATLRLEGVEGQLVVDGFIQSTNSKVIADHASFENRKFGPVLQFTNGDNSQLVDCVVNGLDNNTDLSSILFTNHDVTFNRCVVSNNETNRYNLEIVNSGATFEDTQVEHNNSLSGVTARCGGLRFTSNGEDYLTAKGLSLRYNHSNHRSIPDNVDITGGLINSTDPRGMFIESAMPDGSFEDWSVQIALWDNPNRTMYSLDNCTLKGGTVWIYAADNATVDDFHMGNVIIDDAYVDLVTGVSGTGTHVTLTDGGLITCSQTLTLDKSILDVNLATCPGVVLQANGQNWVRSIQGDPKLAANGEPRWDSPCLDLLDDEDNEFDLTPGDLGGKAYRVNRDLTGTVTDSLALGNYRIVGNTMIRGHIEPGSILRLESGKDLFVYDVPTGEAVRQLGAADAPRTAIVSRPSLRGNPARNIKIFSNTEKVLALDGVLFNFPPRNDLGIGSVIFQNWKPANGDSIVFDSTRVQFWNFIEAPKFNGEIVESRYDGSLVLDHCRATIRQYRFGSESKRSPGYLQLKDWAGNLDSCHFDLPTGQGSESMACLTVEGIPAGAVQTVRENVFEGGEFEGRRPLARLTGAVADFRNNTFQGCRTTPLVITQSTIHADREARNSWLANLSSFDQDSAMIWMQGGFLDLYCGHNNIVVSQANQNWPVIKWTFVDGMPDPASWRENFWGTSCADWIDASMLPALLPPWAIAEDNLLGCVTPQTPANPLCPFEEDTPQELLENGKTAEALGNYGLAQDNYRALLWLWAAKKEANEGTLRLKALGLDKTYGPESYELVRDDLFTAADSSHVVLLSYQEVLQRCSAWCVEARWGDRPLAISSLNTMLAHETNKINRDTIKRALLEIATYPPVGGLQALDGEALFAQAQAQQAATAALMNYQSGQDLPVAGVVEQPKTFAIARLYPNPFNAAVTLELAFPSDGQARVRVFNLLGQVVQSVLDQRVTAGVHTSTLDASRWSSGLYFVVAEHEGAVQVRKMTLLK